MRHEEICHHKQGAEESVIVGLPAERTTSAEIRHTHARHAEFRHHLCAHPSKVLALPEIIFVETKAACMNIITRC